MDGVRCRVGCKVSGVKGRLTGEKGTKELMYVT